MKYFIKWHSARFCHDYIAPISAGSLNEAKVKFKGIYGDDATILDINVSVECAGADVLGQQKGNGLAYAR